MNKTKLKAILPAIDFLNGLHVDFDKREIAATDGHVIVIVENVQGLEGTGRVIIPRNVVEQASKIKTNSELRITPTQIGYADKDFPSFLFNPIESSYKLDYWKVVPSENTASNRFGFYSSENIKLFESIEAAFKTLFTLHCPQDAMKSPLKGVLEADGEKVTICIMPTTRKEAGE